MKKEILNRLKIIFMIFTCIFITSCNKKQKRNISSPKSTIELKSDSLSSSKIDSLIKTISSKLIGEYYVENFSQYLESGFELKKIKPNYDYGIYSFKFTENREIKFEDLTEVYECGNGVLSLNKGKWKILKNGNIELSISGEYITVRKFNTESEYKLSELKNGNIKMDLVKIINK